MSPRTMSIVDYDAWNAGYTPPIEHSLIHELSHGTAKVIMASVGPENGYWLVSKNGKKPRREDRQALWESLQILADDEPAETLPPGKETP